MITPYVPLVLRENLEKVGKPRHKKKCRGRICVGTTWPSRPKVPTFGCRVDMSRTCRRLCQPNDYGVILCPFMTQQSSSILFFGTFIVTHSFSICSFRHWIGSDAAPCWHLLHTHTELGTNFHLNRDSLLGLVAHLLLSYAHNNHNYPIHHRSPCSKLSPPPSFN